MNTIWITISHGSQFDSWSIDQEFDQIWFDWLIWLSTIWFVQIGNGVLVRIVIWINSTMQVKK